MAKNFIIKYGKNYIDSIDITQQILEKCLNKKTNILYIDINLNFNCFQGYNYQNEKSIIIIYNEYIKYFKENRNEYIIIDFNENTNNKFSIKYGLNLIQSIDITNEFLNLNLYKNKIHINKHTDLNNFKNDPYLSIEKTLFINYNNISLHFHEYIDKDIIITFLNEQNTKEDTTGFIILRHVNSIETNQYWKHSYNCIRKFYPENLIIIIDDNSDYKFITNIKMYKTSVIQSEYPKRGELLPYYYYSKNKFFDKAFIIHDSVFINGYIDCDIINYKFLWSFNPYMCNNEFREDIINFLNKFNDHEIISFYKNMSWLGCFGGMCIINYNYLKSINDKYDLSLLLDDILSRNKRMFFERIIGILLQKNFRTEAILGDIHGYCPWGIRFENKDNYKYLPIIKIWTGR